MADDYPQFFRGAQVPESVRARIMAAQLLQQSAAQAERPYTSKGVVALKALSGLLGGAMEGSAIQNETAAQAAHRQNSMAAYLLAGSAGSPGATGAAGPGTVGMSGAPAAGTPISGGIGSDRVASGSHQDFINSIMPQAQKVAAQTGLDARLVAAQAALESNYGQSAPGNNIFGIKGVRHRAVVDHGERQRPDGAHEGQLCRL